MKRLIQFILILFSFIEVYSSPVGNPLASEIIEEGFFISPGSWINFRMGYEGNFTTDARLKNELNKNKIDNFKIDYNSGSFTINLQNRIDLFALLGSTRIRSDWRFSNLDIHYRSEMETDYKPIWAVGGRAVLFEWGNVALGAGGRFTKANPSINFVTINGALKQLTKSKVKYQDWQADFAIAYKIDIFVPYLGAKYLNAIAEVKKFDFYINDNFSNEIYMKNKDRYGVFIGCTFSNGKYFSLTCEARFIDEEAGMISGEFRF